MLSGHGLYVGTVGHQRLSPKRHRFNYPIQLFLLELTAQATLPRMLTSAGVGPFKLRRHDYLANCPHLAELPLLNAAIQCARELGAELTGDEQVFLLSPLANWGRYFSPLTQYYFYKDNKPCYMLAEVSNTPWGERHHYLITMSATESQYQTAKDFHVSPFLPLDLHYHWHFASLGECLRLVIHTIRLTKSSNVSTDADKPSVSLPAEKVFSAWYQLDKQPLTAQCLRRAMIRFPWQNVQIVARIYWHALLIWLKGVPFIAYQNSRERSL